MNKKEQILNLVAEYIQEKHAKKTWKAGEDWVQYSGPYFDSSEYVSAVNTLLNEWLVLGEDTIKFEKRFPPLLGKTHGVIVNSGSSANLLMMAAIASKNIFPKKSKVIIPVAGFPTTLNPILQMGFEPDFVDIDLDTLNLNLDQVDARAKNGAKILMFAHVLGNPPNINRLMNIINQHNILLLEDCCDALGSTYNGKPLGSFGEMASCSFYPAHHITSLPYDEIILLKSPTNKIQIKKIGYFIENEKFEGWKCISFNKECQFEWKPITGVVSHPFTGNHLYKITTQTGRYCTVTGNHSLFRFQNKSGDIQHINAEHLRVGDFIIVPNNIPNEQTKTTVDYINYKRGNWKAYTDTLIIDEDLAFLLGWFVAEGSYHHSKSGNFNLIFTLNKNEQNIAETIKHILWNKFKISCGIYKRKYSNTIDIKLSSKGLYNFFLEYCGRGAKNKYIPEFIFRSPNNIKWKFIEAYYNGDGFNHKIEKSNSDSFDCKTVSKRLSHELYYLLLMLGVSSRYLSYIDQSPKNINKNKNKSYPSDTYSICYNKSLKSIVNSDGFRHNSVKDFCRYKNDLTMIKITKIEKIKYTNPNVYDLSISNYENFIAGLGFTVHNTGEGGFVACNNEETEKVVRSFREWGRQCYCVGKKSNLSKKGTCGCRFNNWLPALPDEIFDHKYVYDNIGYNLKPIEVQCSIGLQQLDKLPEIIRVRKENYQRLFNTFLPYEDFFILPRKTPNSDPSWFAFPLTIKDGIPFKRSTLCHYLEENKIQTRNYFGGNLLLQPAYDKLATREYALSFKNATKVTTDTFFLGTSPVITPQQLDYIAEKVEDFMKDY